MLTLYLLILENHVALLEVSTFYLLVNAFYNMCETPVFVLYHTFFFAYTGTNILIKETCNLNNKEADSGG